VLPAAPAHATGLPPVTQPDAVTVTIDSRPVQVDLTANDVDPEGDRLYFCGTTGTLPQGVRILGGGRLTTIGASTLPGPGDTTGASPGTYIVDTIVCDDTSYVRTQLTITVLASPADSVTVTAGRPGRARVRNDNDVPIRFLWGAEDHKHADGRVDVPAHAARTIRIERRSLLTLVLAGRDYGIGFARHLRPPRGGTALPPGLSHGSDVLHASLTPWVNKAVGA
jgi:hypothetical protein